MPTQPRLDAFASSVVGESLEDLARIGPSQPFQPTGAQLSRRAFDLLARAAVEPIGRQRGSEDQVAVEALTAANLMTARRALTVDGEQITAPLHSPRAVLRADAHGRSGSTSIDIWVGARHALVAAGPPASATLEAELAATNDPSRPVSIDLVGLRVLPIKLASWLGLCPAWQLAIAPAVLPAEVIQHRVSDPSAALPPRADANLAAAWEQPWIEWRLASSARPGVLDYISTGARGVWLLHPLGGSDFELRARPPMAVWRDLLNLIETSIAGD